MCPFSPPLPLLPLSSLCFFSLQHRKRPLTAYDAGHRTIVVGSGLWINCKRYPQQSACAFTWQLRLPVVLLFYGSIVMSLDRVIVTASSIAEFELQLVRLLGTLTIGGYKSTYFLCLYSLAPFSMKSKV